MIDPMVFAFIIPAIFFGGYASLFLKKGAEKFTLNPKYIMKNPIDISNVGNDI